LKAYCLIREQPWYRADAFREGLRKAGYEVVPRRPSDLRQVGGGDVLVIWNRYGEYHDLACAFETRGARVVVAENGYVANDRTNRTRYAVALDGHNGQGRWYPGDGERWRSLGIEVAPWRDDGGHVLVCPNRSFGRPGYIMPPVWPEDVVRRLQRATKRKIKVRPHPGNEPAKTPIEDDLDGAWAVVVWSSSVGVEALLRGVPVVCESPAWIARGAASTSIKDIDKIELPDRMPTLHALAWAQWHIAEIGRGDPFQHLLHRTPA
jgi:hypothetical protein